MALTQYEATYLHEIAEGFTARRPIRRSWRIWPSARDNTQVAATCRFLHGRRYCASDAGSHGFFPAKRVHN